MDDLFAEPRALDLPRGDFAVFGSGPLFVRGLIPFVNDLDVICRGSAWDRVQAVAVPYRDDANDVTLHAVAEGRITFGTRWAIGNPDIDRLIETAEVLSGLPFVRLEHVAACKRIRGSARDREHLQLLERYVCTEFAPGMRSGH